MRTIIHGIEAGNIDVITIFFISQTKNHMFGKVKYHYFKKLLFRIWLEMVVCQKAMLIVGALFSQTAFLREVDIAFRLQWGIHVFAGKIVVSYSLHNHLSPITHHFPSPKSP